MRRSRCCRRRTSRSRPRAASCSASTRRTRAASAIDFLAEHKATFPSLRDRDRSYGREFGVTGYPETFLIDRQGRIAALQRMPVRRRGWISTCRSCWRSRHEEVTLARPPGRGGARSAAGRPRRRRCPTSRTRSCASSAGRSSGSPTRRSQSRSARSSASRSPRARTSRRSRPRSSTSTARRSSPSPRRTASTARCGSSRSLLVVARRGHRHRSQRWRHAGEDPSRPSSRPS